MQRFVLLVPVPFLAAATYAAAVDKRTVDSLILICIGTTTPVLQEVDWSYHDVVVT